MHLSLHLSLRFSHKAGLFGYPLILSVTKEVSINILFFSVKGLPMNFAAP